DASLLRLLISNDGSTDTGRTPLPTADHTGTGLRNLAARLEAAGGRPAAARREDGTFSLAVELPLPASAPVAARLQPAVLRGDPDRVRPVAAAELGHRGGEVGPHRPV